MASEPIVVREPGSKTLYVEACTVAEGGVCRLGEVRLSGDFFVYPETGLEKLEEELKGCASRGCVVEAVERARSHAVFVGFPWKSLVDVLSSILEGCRQRRAGV